MEVYARYSIPDEKGETRRDRNERFGHDAPPLEIPEDGRYLWEWYQEVADGTARFRENLYHPITWADLKAWADCTGNIVYSSEFDILRAMDAAFTRGMNINVQERQTRAMDEAKKGGKRK